MARPIMGWFGVIDERVDYGLVGEIARTRPEWSFAMVGPVVKIDPNLLPHSPNLFWLGQRDYTVLPNYCRAFDICIMPFAINQATQFINPTKTLEYLATGKPIISTPVSDVIRQFDGLVEIVKSADDFVSAAERILAQPDPDRIARGIERAKASSWESTVKSMRDIIAESIGKSDRRSSRKLEPSADDVLTYRYMPTPGS
jgi:glycosyltransferase involved in cell wall biosynthesis